MYTARLVNFHVYYCNHIIDIGKKKNVFSFYSAYIVANFIDGAALAVLLRVFPPGPPEWVKN